MHAVKVASGSLVTIAIVLLAAQLASRPEPVDDDAGESMYRSSDEIEDNSTNCFPDPRCGELEEWVVATQQQLRPITDDPGVIDNRIWRACVAANCRLYECGVPALPVLIAGLVELRDIDGDIARQIIDTYDLHHARAIINRVHALRAQRIEACRPPRAPGEVAPTDWYEHLDEAINTFMRFRIARDGTLEDILVDGHSKGNHVEVASCLADVFRDLRFPPSIHGEALEIRHQIALHKTPSNF